MLSRNIHLRNSRSIVSSLSKLFDKNSSSTTTTTISKSQLIINTRSNLLIHSTRNMVTQTKPGDKLIQKTSNQQQPSTTIDLNEFNDIYEQAHLKAIDDINNDELPQSINQSLNEAKEWLKTVMDYNVGKGKCNRARICWLAYRQLCSTTSNDDSLLMMNREEKNLQIGILGFCLELLQAYFLIYDDIMDGSLTRRGQNCWYRKDEVGMIAINDGVMLSSLMHYLLKQNLGSSPMYTKIVELFNDVTRYTSYGQCLDILSNPHSSSIDFSKFTQERYATIVQFKTAYYTFSLPIRLAMYLVGISDPNVHQEAEEILLKIGHFFQAQDDYLDCFGNPQVTGKIGTDIEDGKCSWLFIQAKNLANDNQRKLLYQHYGCKSEESIQIVRNLYKELCLEKIFAEYEQQKYHDICSRIEQIEEKILPKDLFHMVLTMIYKRKQ